MLECFQIPHFLPSIWPSSSSPLFHCCLLVLKLCAPEWVWGMPPPNLGTVSKVFCLIVIFPLNLHNEACPLAVLANPRCYPAPGGAGSTIFNRPNKFATKGKSILAAFFMMLLKLLLVVLLKVLLTPLDHSWVELPPEFFLALGCKQVHGTEFFEQTSSRHQVFFSKQVHGT